jgi:hypothetical protein
MDITYSGVNGVNFNFGEEFISIPGKTTVPIVMKAFAYEAGAVDVTYSWASTVSSCCLGTAACTGTFDRTLAKKMVTTDSAVMYGPVILALCLAQSVRLFE